VLPREATSAQEYDCDPPSKAQPINTPLASRHMTSTRRESLLARQERNATLDAVEAMAPFTPLDLSVGQIDAFKALDTEEGRTADHSR
jgi:hypothetical protein